MKKNKGPTLHSYIYCLLFIFTFTISTASWAASIENLSLLDSEDGDVLIIESDSPLEYQVFDLSEPPRLVMTFPGATIADSVAAIKGDAGGVSNLFPKVNELGVRIEVGLTEALSYEVDEQGNSLIIRFEAPKAEEGSSLETTRLETIKVRDKAGLTEVIIDGMNMNGSHNAFVTNENKSFVIDFWGAKSLLKKEFFPYSSQRVKSITVGEADDRLRLILDLIPLENMARQIDTTDGRMTIRLGKIKETKSVVTVESVDFQPDGRSANIMVRTNVTNPVVEVFEQGDNTIIDIAGASLAQGQERSQDLSAFAGPITQVDTYKKGNKVRVVVRLREDVQVSTFQQGNAFSMNFLPKALVASGKGRNNGEGSFSYIGERVTFDFKDIDIKNALKLIAEMSELNIIMSEDVSGTLTMRLIDVPWDQALDLILSSRGLGKEKSGNVLRVAPIEVLRNEYAAKIEARKGSLQLEPLITAFITLNYTKVDAVKTMLEESGNKQQTTRGADGALPESENSGLLSSRGSVLVDKRTNTLIIKDTLEAVNNIKRLISAIDKPIQQVLIEARIVEASDKFTHAIGVRWGGNVNRETNYNFPGAVAIGAAGTTAENSGNIISGGQSAAANKGFLVDLPAAGNGGAIGLSLGSFSNAINLDLELSAAQADGNAKIISNPRIVTSNLTPASVTQGTLVPIVTPGTANAPATTKLVTAALTLTVTPQITADNGVILDVQVTKDSPTIFNGSTGIDSKAVSTNVYVKNGETIVIGGVYTRDKGTNSEGVPGLSEIPFLGWLFKSESTRDNKSELLIFITPKVMQTGTATQN